MKFPFWPVPGPTSGGQKKMSEIVEEMAELALKPPIRSRSPEAVKAALYLAAFAWNAAVGQPFSRDGLARLPGPNAELPPIPWAELRADNASQLLALLVDYKTARYPADFRRIVSTELRPDNNVRVSWTEGFQPAGASAAAAAPSAARPAGSPAAAGAVGSAPAAAAPTTDRPLTAQPAPVQPVVVPPPVTRTAAAGRSARRRQPIADKLVKSIKRYTQSKVVDLGAVIAGRKNAEDLLQTVVDDEDLVKLQPAHAVHVYVHNLFSVMAEQLSGLKETNRLLDLVAAAEEEYMPSGPPMSPLTGSYFNCWALFDACLGSGGETIGSVALAVASVSGMHSEWLGLMRLQLQSRMGIYVHQGVEKNVVRLRELVTGHQYRAIPTSGYRGKAGEIWYVRLLPPPLPGMSEHVVFTTPYLLVGAVEHEWQSYFRRTLPDTPEARIEAYEQHMKFGPSRRYWHEFVLEAYVNYASDVVFLTGLPDIPESRPHSAVNSLAGG